MPKPKISRFEIHVPKGHNIEVHVHEKRPPNKSPAIHDLEAEYYVEDKNGLLHPIDGLDWHHAGFAGWDDVTPGWPVKATTMAGKKIAGRIARVNIGPDS